MQNKIVMHCSNTLIMSALIFLTACTGWHLRGQVTLDPNLMPILIRPDSPYSPLQILLHKQFELSKIIITEDPDEAKSVLTLSDDGFSSRSNIIAASGETKEKQLTYTLGFQLVDSQQHSLLAPQKITVSNNVSYDEDALLSSQSDAESHKKTLRVEAISQLMRRLGKTKPKPVLNAMESYENSE